MTDNEIIKALECCCIAKLKVDCKKLECPFYNYEIDNCNYIDNEEAIYKAALDLINRQKAEIERLKTENNQFADIGKMYSEIKAEAIKEYKQRLKSKAGDTILYGHSLVSLATSFVTVKVIDETYDEMVGEG